MPVLDTMYSIREFIYFCSKQDFTPLCQYELMKMMFHIRYIVEKRSRIVGITLCRDNLQYDFVSVYMPYQCDENYDLYMQCIGKLCTLLEESCTNNIVILGDFNVTLNSVFESELLEMCSTFDLVISDYGTFGQTSGQFTHVSDAHGTTSWLDHVICSSDMQNNVVSIEILESHQAQTT